VTQYTTRVHNAATEDLVCEWIDYGRSETADRFWTLDPIDGTKGFLRGEQFVVALALVENGRVVIGALACPNLNAQLESDIGGRGCITLAVRERGAWIGVIPGHDLAELHVSNIEDTKRARLLRSKEPGHTDVDLMARFVEQITTEEAPVLMDSQAKFATVAGGKAELIVRLVTPHRPHYCEYIWDQAAGSIIVEEAGGMVTDLRGQALDFSTGRRLRNNIGVLVSNRKLHSAALDALHVVGADKRPIEA
jgi:3'(2'), 5'-bisphosphate nucleotidase